MRKLLFLLTLATALSGQQGGPPPAQPPAAGGTPAIDTDRVLKQVDDLMWHFKLGDIAEIDKVEYTSAPPARIQNPKAPGAGNPLIIRAYTFIPKNLDR